MRGGVRVRDRGRKIEGGRREKRGRREKGVYREEGGRERRQLTLPRSLPRCW